MDESISDGSVVRYYCTAGNGMEPFLIDEVKRKLAAEDVYQMPGKVLFSSSAPIHRVRNLKAAERLFLLLKQDSPLQMSAKTSPAKAASMLKSKLLGDKNQWTSAVMTWSRLQGELTTRRTTIKTSRSALGVTKERAKGRGSEAREKKEEGRESGEQKEEWPRKSEGEQREEEESGNGRLRSSEQNGTQSLEKKRKRNDEEDVEERKGPARDSSNKKNAEQVKTFERESRTGEVDRTQIEFNSSRKNLHEKGSVYDHTTPGLEHNVASSRRMTEDIKTNFATESVENVKTAGQGDEVPLQTCKEKPEQPPCIPVTFRICCKCTGSAARCLGTQEVSRVIGVSLCRLLGWKSDLKTPELEINIYLSDDHCLLGIPLTRLPLANRSYIKTTGLRSTVAWAMASLAEIQPGFRVVDPMCGVGTILTEAAQEHEGVCFLGVDIDDGQLQKANENIAFAELGNRMHLLKASSMMLPLPSSSVNCVVCDLPFGKKFGTRTNMAANLPLILAEMERILCGGGTLVLLLSPQLSCVLKKLLIQKDTEPTSNQEIKPHTGVESCSSATKQQTFQIHPGVKSSPIQESEHQHSLQPALSSLKHQATFRVSLGAIDGLIHKYIKADA